MRRKEIKEFENIREITIRFDRVYNKEDHFELFYNGKSIGTACKENLNSKTLSTLSSLADWEMIH